MGDKYIQCSSHSLLQELNTKGSLLPKKASLILGVAVGHMSLKLSKLLRVTITHLQLTSLTDDTTSDGLPDSPTTVVSGNYVS